MDQVARNRVIEISLKSARGRDDPGLELSVTVIFQGPSGQEIQVPAFWDGGATWRCRFAPPEPGQWRWRSQCSDAADSGLHGAQGSFRCTDYEGANPIHARGPLRLSDDRRHLCWADGTPFFWLADTAWNGVLRATMDGWRQYLQQRREQGFTAIQFVCTHWRGSPEDPFGERAFSIENGRLAINPRFFQRMDAKVQAINEAGLVAAPVVLWAYGQGDPGHDLPADQAAAVARYIIARWAAHCVVWLLGGDGRYAGDGLAEKWRQIGRAAFPEGQPRAPATLHPCGRHWPYDELWDEPWLDIAGYQSSHSAAPEVLQWILTGPPARSATRQPPKPIINLEPNYEAHPAFDTKKPFDDLDVRRACYFSLLSVPPAGVTYGHNWVWPWREEPGVPAGHPAIGEVRPWAEALGSPGAWSMKHLADAICSISWWKLRPAPALLLAQPGQDDVYRWVVAAVAADGSCAAIYTPVRQQLPLNTALLADGVRMRWVNPSTGGKGKWDELPRPKATLTPPGDGDWLVLFSK